MPDGWTRLDIGGKPADMFEPPAGPAARYALLWLHDADEHSPPDALTQHLARLRLPCIAPHADGAWWADRVCPAFDPALTAEQHLLRNVVPWMAARWALGPRGVGAAGVGMGGQGAVRLGLKYPDRFPAVASAGGAFDHHEWYGRGTPLDAMYATREHCRQDTAVLHVQPFHWPPHLWLACDPASVWFRGNDRLHEKLTALGVPHAADLDTTTGGDAGAYLEGMLAPMLAYLADGLNRESRRLM